MAGNSGDADLPIALKIVETNLLMNGFPETLFQRPAAEVMEYAIILSELKAKAVEE